LSNSLGPAVGGIVLAAGGPPGAFTTAGVLFAVSLVLLLAVRVSPRSAPPSPAPSAPWRELGDGLRYVRRHRILAPLPGVIRLSEMCFSGPVALGLVLLADERGWGASGTGWMLKRLQCWGGSCGLMDHRSRAGSPRRAERHRRAAGHCSGHGRPGARAVPDDRHRSHRSDWPGQWHHRDAHQCPGSGSGRSSIPRPGHLPDDAVHAGPGPRPLPRHGHHRATLGRGCLLRRVRRDQSAGGRAGHRGPGPAARPTPRHKGSTLTRSGLLRSDHNAFSSDRLLRRYDAITSETR
jgi:hypothetical protein